MKSIWLTMFVALFLVLSQGGMAGAESKHSQHAGKGTCALGITLSEAAERKAGGALFEKPPTAHHGHKKGAMEQMKGAHMRHQPQHGGAFYMAGNMMHHLEIIYRDACGFAVVFYNAHTEAIRADRFRAFLMAVPDDESEAEVVRILTPADDAASLRAPLGQTISKPFQIRLHVKFPGQLEPQLFTKMIGAGGN